jgi:hypothetical protein
MPSSGTFLPRASLAPGMGPAARREYREKGWRLGAIGGVGLAMVVGPCARCRRPTVRYGRWGRPVCDDCP